MTTPDPSTVTAPAAEETEATEPVVPAAPVTATTTATEPAAPGAPTAPAAPAKPAVTFTPEQQEALNEIVAARAARATEKATQAATKTADERIAELEAAHAASTAAAEAKALNAVISLGVSNSVDPETAALIVRQRLGDLTSDNEADILALAAQVLVEKPYLAPAPGTTTAPAPVLTAAPGVNTTTETKTFMSQAEMDEVTSEELNADEELMKRYIESRNALDA